MLRSSRRVEALVFALTLFGVAYFHQGGGWNQNVRFALVRAIVEEGTFFIDSYLVYGSDPDASEADKLIRYPLQIVERHRLIRHRDDEMLGQRRA